MGDILLKFFLNCAIEQNLPFWRYFSLPNLSSFSLVNITQNNFDIFKGKAQNDKSVIVLLPLFLCLFFGATHLLEYIYIYIYIYMISNGLCWFSCGWGGLLNLLHYFLVWFYLFYWSSMHVYVVLCCFIGIDPANSFKVYVFVN